MLHHVGNDNGMERIMGWMELELACELKYIANQYLNVCEDAGKVEYHNYVF